MKLDYTLRIQETNTNIPIFIDLAFIPVPEVAGNVYVDIDGEPYKFVGLVTKKGKYKTKIVMDYNSWRNHNDKIQKYMWIIRRNNSEIVRFYPTSISLLKIVRGRADNLNTETILIEFEIEFIIKSN